MGIILRQKSTDRCLIGEKMTEFESRIDDSSASNQRSRSDRVISHALLSEGSNTIRTKNFRINVNTG